MKRIKKTIAISALPLFLCCEYGVDITVKNNTDSIIDSILILNDFSKIKLKKIEKNKSKAFFINFENSKHKGDGVFILQTFINDKVKNQQFGYFSNGVPPSHDFIINIYNDTIKIDRY